MVTESRRYHPTKFTRLVVYPIGFIFFVLTLLFLIVLANGYKFSLSEGKFLIVKTGMIITNSRPGDATIVLDNKTYTKKTGFYFLPIKINNILPGEHTISINKSGYRKWSNKVVVRANLVNWVNYVLLFPDDLKIKPVDNLNNKNIIATSKNRRYLLVSGKEENVDSLFAYDQVNGNLNKIWPKKDFVPTEEWLKTPIINSAEFNQDNDKLLLSVKNGATDSFAVLETAGDGKIYPLTAITLPITKITWSSNEPNELFFLSSSKLYRTNIARLAEYQEIASNVIDFTSEKNRTVYYVTLDAQNQASLNQMNQDGTRKEVIENSIKPESGYRISYSAQRDSLAVLGNDSKILVIYYRLNNKINRLELSRDIANFKWSSDGDNIFYHNGHTVKRFNFTEEKETVLTVKDNIVRVDWYFDESHFIVQTDKELFVIDFDGANKVNLSEQAVNLFSIDPKYSSVIFSNTKDNQTINQRFDGSF